MKPQKDLKTRITEFIDKPSTRYLYLVPIVGGVKCYRTTKQIKLLEHATDRSRPDYLSRLYEITPGYKVALTETAKLLALLVIVGGLLNDNVAAALAAVGYFLSSYAQQP